MKYKLLHVVTLDHLTDETRIDLPAGTWVDFSEYPESSTEDGVNIVLNERGVVVLLDLDDGEVDITDMGLSPGTAQYCLLATCLLDTPMETLAKYVATKVISECDWQIQDLVRNRLEGLI